MSRAVRCGANSCGEIGAIALGAIVVDVHDGECEPIGMSPSELFKLLVRSRDEKTYRVVVEQGVLRWLDNAPAAPKPGMMDETEAALWDALDKSSLQQTVVSEESFQRLGCKIRSSQGNVYTQVKCKVVDCNPFYQLCFPAKLEACQREAGRLSERLGAFITALDEGRFDFDTFDS
ncbi:hypothetical protein GNI_108070 [Gregarina niphandrodes]|uniref:Uncharacterized protein n=1 Tax=Gregarina niphandrodes TaxID=110365 RepID=A0A023B3S6_GRENI|nr:hypothetical protein GNI_108070 [Gregarina niphandrodes]EZG55865.1 hypothetical protein GNI_108070 [Gregarina niphandrodes]|eukprot:XP_011131436.1 hypothetical protein GNI_108070 [Gregarina niphandrodes]